MPDEGNRRGGSYIFPIVLIVLGALFLYSEFRPAFNPWPILRTYWPLLLILIGLGKIYDSTRRRKDPGAPDRFSVGSAIGAVALVLLLVAIFWHGRALSRNRGGDSSTGHETKIIELQDAKSVQATVEMGAGELTLAGGTDRLLDATFDFTDSWMTPQVDYQVSQGKGELRISQDGSGPHIGRNENTWDLRLNKNVPISLKVDMGAGQGNLKLQDVNITRLDLNIGAGEVNVDLTGDRKTDLRGDINGGVGQANIRLPKNVGVIVHASGFIGSIEAPGFKQDGSEYSNEAVGKTGATIRLNVQGAIGQIVLEQE